MAKSFTNINTSFDVIDAITGEATIAPKEKSLKKPVGEKAPEKKQAKRDSSPITIETKETRSKRATILIKESTYTKLSSYAKKYNLSFNDLINQILDKVKL